MLGFFKDLFGGGSKKISEAIKNGAILVDVRSQGEFSSGSVKGSINIPLDKLSVQLSKLKKDRTIIVFCASGMRSASAKSILDQNNYTDVINGGSWRKVQDQIELEK